MPVQRLALLVAVLVTGYSALAQPSQSAFLHYTSDDGLSHDHVTDIVKDQLGFLWVATVNGLNRYDGRSFKIFRHDPSNINSLPHNYIRAISLAPDGYLWIATMSGLCKLDPLWLDITRVTLPENLDSVENDAVTIVCFDSEGMAWTTGQHGLYRINPRRTGLWRCTRQNSRHRDGLE